MKKIFFALLMLSIFANIPSDVFSWSGTPSSSVNLANSAGAAVTPKQNLAKGEAGGGGSVPVGTIIAWPVATNPSDADKWLECNGQTITQAAYPELYAVVGSYVPDLRNRMLQGSTSPGVYLSAGLPNIRASWDNGTTPVVTPLPYASGAVYLGENNKSREDCASNNGQRAYFDASRYDSIYGNSSTVQPPAYTTRFLIKAKS